VRDTSSYLEWENEILEAGAILIAATVREQPQRIPFTVFKCRKEKPVT
jgi:hypothetical protein